LEEKTTSSLLLEEASESEKGLNENFIGNGHLSLLVLEPLLEPGFRQEQVSGSSKCWSSHNDFIL
jgi:hypothetical protein